MASQRWWREETEELLAGDWELRNCSGDRPFGIYVCFCWRGVAFG
ncbi:hypothetical protein Hanom_Chr16g01521361 [Helianthus anomalus]